MNISRQIKLLALQYRLAVVVCHFCSARSNIQQTTNHFVSGKRPAMGESWTYVPHTQLQLEHIDYADGVARPLRRVILNRSPHAVRLLHTPLSAHATPRARDRASSLLSAIIPPCQTQPRSHLHRTTLSGEQTIQGLLLCYKYAERVWSARGDEGRWRSVWRSSSSWPEVSHWLSWRRNERFGSTM